MADLLFVNTKGKLNTTSLQLTPKSNDLNVSLRSRLERVFFEYTNKTKVSGIFYLRQHQTNGLTRLFIKKLKYKNNLNITMNNLIGFYGLSFQYWF